MVLPKDTTDPTFEFATSKVEWFLVEASEDKENLQKALVLLESSTSGQSQKDDDGTKMSWNEIESRVITIEQLAFQSRHGELTRYSGLCEGKSTKSTSASSCESH